MKFSWGTTFPGNARDASRGHFIQTKTETPREKFKGSRITMSSRLDKRAAYDRGHAASLEVRVSAAAVS
jgi:hypothetical protein